MLGAGPIGLEAALAARQAGFECVVYEAGEVGGHVISWGHVRLFTPWSMNVSPRAAAALGKRAPRGAGLPTGAELAGDLLEPVAGLPELEGVIQRHTRVVGVGREGLLKHEAIGDPARGQRSFRLLVEGPDGVERVDRADVVIDATGTSGNPNRLGDGGIEAVGERSLGARIARAIPDLAEAADGWAGRTTLLVGAGHSAQTAARDLAELSGREPQTRVVWAVRSTQPTWGAVEDDPLAERAALNATASGLLAGECAGVTVHVGTTVEALRERAGRVSVTLGNGELEEVEVDRVLSLVGGVPDAGLYRQLQVQECYATLGPLGLAAALLGETGGDCLAEVRHGPQTLRNPEPGFFILGAKSYGRNSQFLLRVGWQQVDDVFGSLI
ncbi:MAG TPA: FAD-dependent oxidoreductase [Solirubrobacteraceae bacterium]|nr:FAD-dependent oxidoreductase [Solirubrobacteraceae bacterium]